MRAFHAVIGILGLLLIVAAPAWGTAKRSTTALVPLDRPAGLEPDIAFWRRIFAEVSNDAGLLHDHTRLDIVYAELPLPKQHTSVERRRIVDAAVGRYTTILNQLAAGARADLGDDAKHVLALWGPTTKPAEFRAAAGRLRFQLGQADRFRAGLIRSGRWANFIERTLAEQGLPPELIALPHVESGYHPLAGSHLGAMGLWQFMPGTGREFMRVDGVADERLDPYVATESAARLLRRNFAVTGTWPTAITAYNHGAGGMQRAIAELGTTDIETLVRRYRGRAFGFASRNFYVSFLAAADVRADADRYFGRLRRDPPDSSLVVQLPGYVAIDALARALAVDTQTIARRNPSLRSAVWQGARLAPRGHRLYLPPQGGLTASALLARLPAALWSDSQIADLFHVVSRGETLSAIAPRYGVQVADLVALNGLRNPNAIRAGQRLTLPARGASR
ncbi:MAG: transglycosylase SLT domain-containing protein [Pseudomonadales bacterium]